MSHRIVDDIAVVRFAAADLRAAIDHYAFYADHFLVFELGGDNNCFQTHPRTYREVRSRSWNLVAAGPDCGVMRQMVHFAASCEGGGMRFNGERSTLPETYIRRVRSVVLNAVRPEAIVTAGLSCTVTIEPRVGEESNSPAEDIASLTAILAPDMPETKPRWTLHPLVNITHAAILFAYPGLDDRTLWNRSTIRAYTFDPIPIMRRAAPTTTPRSAVTNR